MRIGIEKIDQQHQTMVDRLNRMNQAVMNGSSESIVDGLLADLYDYTRYPFSCEEDLHECYDYPNAEEHRKIHEALVRKVANIDSRFQRGDIDLSSELLELLKTWVFGHIKEHDMRFRTHLDHAH